MNGISSRNDWEWTNARPSVGETPMTGAERQARYRTAHAAGAPIIRIRRPANRRSRIQPGTTRSPRPLSCRPSMPHGWTRCRTTNRTARSPMGCGRLSNSIYLSFRRSNPHAASAVIEQRDGPTAWATMTRAAAYRHQPVSAGTAR
jgi:hypothetical protein